MKKNKQDYLGKPSRTQGDLLVYFIIHNSISVLLFFVLTIYFEVYVGTELLIGYVFQREFWEMVLLEVFPISVFSSITARLITLYGIINGYIWYKNRKRIVKKSPKRWSELNQKINKVGIAFFLTSLLTSIIYGIGLIGILQIAIFNETTLTTLIIVYTGFKIGTFLFVRYIVGRL